MYNSEVHVAKHVRVPLSAARARLFELADLVRQSGDDTVVILEHRGSREQVALVRETQLAYLEAKVRELEKRAENPFTLAGSLATDLDVDTLEAALRQIRQDWAPGPPREAVRAAKRARGTRR
jgi:hypothetical protein